MESPNLFAENVWNFPISLFPDDGHLTVFLQFDDTGGKAERV